MANWKSVTLFTDVIAANVQTAHDDYQFVWVDGRDNNIARRVVINSDGEIVAAANASMTKIYVRFAPPAGD